MLAVAMSLFLQAAGLPLAPESEAAPSPPKLARPDWQMRPSQEDIARVYPPAAAQAGVAGKALMACTVTEEGRMAGCEILEEEPPQAGFGEAALKLQRRFKMMPKTKDGDPVGGGRVVIPVRFAVPQ